MTLAARDAGWCGSNGMQRLWRQQSRARRCARMLAAATAVRAHTCAVSTPTPHVRTRHPRHTHRPHAPLHNRARARRTPSTRQRCRTATTGWSRKACASARPTSRCCPSHATTRPTGGTATRTRCARRALLARVRVRACACACMRASVPCRCTLRIALASMLHTCCLLPAGVCLSPPAVCALSPGSGAPAAPDQAQGKPRLTQRAMLRVARQRTHMQAACVCAACAHTQCQQLSNLPGKPRCVQRSQQLPHWLMPCTARTPPPHALHRLALRTMLLGAPAAGRQGQRQRRRSCRAWRVRLSRSGTGGCLTSLVAARCRTWQPRCQTTSRGALQQQLLAAVCGGTHGSWQQLKWQRCCLPCCRAPVYLHAMCAAQGRPV